VIYGLTLSAAGAMASEHQMEVLSNNLANVATTGFKRELAAFRQAPLEADLRGAGPAFRHPVADGVGGGLFTEPTFIDLRPAPLKQTEGPTDLALEDEGFFLVDTPAGQRLTRDGRLKVAGDGRLVRLVDGEALLGVSGRPIELKPGKPFTVTAAGVVRQDGQDRGQLAVVTAEGKSLRASGGGLFSLVDGARTRPAEAPTVRQGYLEESGVEPTTEMTDLILASRAYELNARMIQNQDRTLGQLINTVARIR
jgi:flagellar basal body rod protein FlgG